MKVNIIFFALVTLAIGCEKEEFSKPQPIPKPFYGASFGGSYRSIKILSNNGIDATPFLKIRLDLEENPYFFQFSLTEKNPSIGTIDSILILGNWEMTKGLDTLYLTFQTGASAETITTDWGTSTTTVYTYRTDTLWGIQKISSGIYRMNRKYRGTKQQIDMERL